MRKNLPWILLLGPILAMSVANLIAWSHLPDRIPLHWNFRGEVDSWGPRASIWILPGIYLWVGGFLRLVTMRLPGSEETSQHQSNQLAVNWTMTGVAFLFLYLYAQILLDSLVPKDQSLPLASWGFGVFTIFMGLGLRYCKRNNFIGIRTKWTLASDEVWDKTHKLGSALFLAAGLVITAAASVFNILSWLAVILGICGVTTYLSYRYARTSQP